MALLDYRAYEVMFHMRQFTPTLSAASLTAYRVGESFLRGEAKRTELMTAADDAKFCADSPVERMVGLALHVVYSAALFHDEILGSPGVRSHHASLIAKRTAEVLEFTTGQYVRRDGKFIQVTRA